MRPRIRVPHGGDADPRGPARHQAVHRGAVGRRSRRSATGSTRGSAAGDVRLTMGGEPTFVSIDDRDGAEWNTDGAGPEQAAAGRRAARAAARPLRPGRLAALTGRASGIPASRCRAGRSAATGGATASAVWQDPGLVADEIADYGYGEEDAGASSGRLADRLGVDPEHCDARLRGRLVLPLEGAAAAGQRRLAREPASKTPRSGAGWRASSSRAWTRSSATPCRCAGSGVRRRDPSGSAARGSSAASACS